MSAQIINGKALASQLREEIASNAAKLRQTGVIPGLAVVLVGEDPASASYVTAKGRACEENGIFSRDIRLDEQCSQDQLLSVIHELNNDAKIHGILVQLPLPKHIDSQLVIDAISPLKDVDGFHPVSLGKMLLGREGFLPCTPHGILKLLEFAGVSPSGKHCVIVGRSNIVGKPLANMLIQRGPLADATVTVCHSRTTNLRQLTLQADILIAALGVPQFITADMIAPETVVIDVGVNRVEDSSKKRGYRLVGDVDFEPVSQKASLITPVPGGVGPMTITMLLWNTIQSAQNCQPLNEAQ